MSGGAKWVARNPAELGLRASQMVMHCHNLPADEWPVLLQCGKYDPARSLNQNALIYGVYRDISQQTGELLVDIRRHCKLHYGVPILRAHDKEFRAIYDKMVNPHAYEDKLAIMDFLPVTSRMKKPQATEYIDTVMREYADRVKFAA